MFNFQEYKKIRENINFLGKKTEIVAISKNHPQEDIEKAISCGLEIFGENRVQEARLKFENILKNNKKIKLHLTGPLQTNKVKVALELFSVFHTLDREKLVRELIKFPEKTSSKSFFIQVNTGNEPQKFGVALNNAEELIQSFKDYKIKVSGLMCLPPENEDPSKHFQILQSLAQNNHIKNLSMGMTNDFHIALKYGSTHIRIGSAIFGKRI